MNQLEQTKIALLREASKTLNTISKVKSDGAEFVKCKHAYAHPEEIRTLYLQALDSLIEDGSTELVLTNEYLDLFELKQTTPLSTLAAAKEALLRQLKQDGRIYKIHSPQGEFVQCKKFALGGADRPDENEEESRIVFLRALSELMRYGKVDLVSESREMSVFAPAMQYSSAVAATEIYEDLRQCS
ncbi:MAG: hypothetical protein WCT03_26990 [Candidatus Obscuribacterales bacterium]|jgi:hypothetical protein